jgi:NADPH2:quinone reductase
LAPNGVDVIYDPVGGDVSEAALRCLAWEGRHLVVGFAAGPIPKIPANLLLLKGAQLVGVFWGAFAEREPGRNASNVAGVLALVASGAVRPHIDAAFPFERAGEALSRLAERRVLGKVVLVP